MKRSAGTSFVAAWLAALLCLTAVGCGGGGGYASPQAAFDAMKAAAEKKDWRGVFKCMTPDSQDGTAGVMVVEATMMKTTTRGGEEADEAKTARHKIDEVLKKHGVDEEALEELERGDMMPFSEVQALCKKLGAPIKDKPAFVAEMLAAKEEMNPDESTRSFEDATLIDVKIDGDEATGTYISTVEGKRTGKPISFKRIGGVWLIHMAWMRCW